MKIFSLPATILLAAVTTGCSPTSTSPPDTSKISHTFSRGDLCDALEDFFTDELHAIDTDWQMITGSADQPITAGASCDVINSANGSLYGTIRVRHAPDDPNPIGNMKEHYVETDVQGASVWVFDESDSSKYAGSRVTFATTIGGWFGNLAIEEKEVRTADGAFQFTDTEKRSASSFLVELTTRVAESPSQ